MTNIWAQNRSSILVCSYEPIQKCTEQCFQAIFFCLWSILFYSVKILWRLADEIKYSWSKYAVAIVHKLVFSCSDYRTLNDVFLELPKRPKSIGIAVAVEQNFSKRKMWPIFLPSVAKNYESLDEEVLKSLSKTICWCWAFGVDSVIVYDKKGLLKQYRGRIEELLQSEISCIPIKDLTKNMLRQLIVESEDCFINADSHKNGWTNRANNVDFFHKDSCLSNASSKCSLYFNSEDDCKPVIVQIVKDLKRDHKCESITESQLDKELKKYTPYLDPEILMVFGANYSTTLGFLPWHIRLTEIFWLPNLQNLLLDDFVHVMKRYSTCQQRFGA